MRLLRLAAWPRVELALLSLVWGSSWIGNQWMAADIDPLRAGVLCFGTAWLALGLAAVARRWLRAMPGPRLHSRVPLWRVPVRLQAGSSARTFEASSIPCIQLTRTGPGMGELLPCGRLEPRACLRVGSILGCTMLGLPFLLLDWSAQHGSGAWSPLVYAALPLGLGIRSGRLHAAAIVATGAMLALLNGSLPLSIEKLLWTVPIVVAVALQGWSLTYVRAQLEQASSLLGLYAQFQGASWLLILAGSLLSHRAPTGVHLPHGQTLLAACAMGLPVYAAGYLVYYRLLRVLEPEQVATVQWLQTLVAVGESAWLLRRIPGWVMLVSAAVLLACAWLLLQEEPATPLTLMPKK